MLFFTTANIYRAAGALPEISEHTRSRIFICPLRYIYNASDAVWRSGWDRSTRCRVLKFFLRPGCTQKGLRKQSGKCARPESTLASRSPVGTSRVLEHWCDWKEKEDLHGNRLLGVPGRLYSLRQHFPTPAAPTSAAAQVLVDLIWFDQKNSNIYERFLSLVPPTF